MRGICALCALFVVWKGVFADNMEVSVAVDGSVVAEIGPLYTVAPDISAKHEDVVQNDEIAVLGPQKEGSEVSKMKILQYELLTLEQMIKLQDKKLEVLQKMRSTWLQEQETPVEHQRMTNVAQLIEQRIDAAVAESFGASEKNFDSYFIERASTVLQKQIVDLKMAKISATSPVELIALAFADGEVVFTTSTGQELLRIKTERQRIKSIALASQDDHLCLVVMYDTAVVSLYKLNLVQARNTGSEVADTGREFALSVGEYHSVQISATASAVAIARSSRQLVVAVAQTDGIIDFLALNGSSLRQMQTNATISTMETKRNLLAFSNGVDVVVSSMTRAQSSSFHSCPGTSANVTSIAFDAVHPDILYTGTQRGEVLVYVVNTGVSTGGQGCRLLSRSMVKQSFQEFTPVVLATSKMYVIAAGPQDITVFNVSRSQKNGLSLSQVCSNHLDSAPNLQSNGEVSAPAMAFSEGLMGANLAFVTATTDGLSKLLLFHCLLSEDSEVSDSQGTILLFVGVIFAGVVGSQLFIRWQRQTSVNPWDSIGKAHAKSFGKYGTKYNEAAEFDGEEFGRYNSLSDELKGKIAQARRGSDHHPMDNDADY